MSKVIQFPGVTERTPQPTKMYKMVDGSAKVEAELVRLAARLDEAQVQVEALLQIVRPQNRKDVKK